MTRRFRNPRVALSSPEQHGGILPYVLRQLVAKA